MWNLDPLLKERMVNIYSGDGIKILATSGRQIEAPDRIRHFFLMKENKKPCFVGITARLNRFRNWDY